MLFGQNGGQLTGNTFDRMLSENPVGKTFIHRSSLDSADLSFLTQKICPITSDTIRNGIREADFDGTMKS